MSSLAFSGTGVVTFFLPLFDDKSWSKFSPGFVVVVVVAVTVVIVVVVVVVIVVVLVVVVAVVVVVVAVVVDVVVVEVIALVVEPKVADEGDGFDGGFGSNPGNTKLSSSSSS